MALVVDAWKATVTLAASNMKKLTKTYELQAASYVDATAALDDILAQLALVSAGKVVGTSVSEKQYEDAFTPPTSNDAEWGEEALITGPIAGDPFESWNIRIPFPLITLFEGTTGKARDRIDTDNAAVLGYVGLFNSGGAAYISDGEFTSTTGDIEGRRVN